MANYKLYDKEGFFLRTVYVPGDSSVLTIPDLDPIWDMLPDGGEHPSDWESYHFEGGDNEWIVVSGEETYFSLELLSEEDGEEKDVEIRVQIEGWVEGSGWEYSQDLDPYNDTVTFFPNGAVGYNVSAMDYIQEIMADGGYTLDNWENFKSGFEEGRDTYYTLYIYDEEDEKIELDGCYESAFWKNRRPDLWAELDA